MRPFLLLSAASVALGDRQSFDCAARDLAVEFAAASNPTLSAFHLQEIADALNGSPEKTPGCNVTVPASLLDSRGSIPRFRPYSIPTAGAIFYVDYNKGNDASPGTQSSPFKTVAKALSASRAGGGGGTIVLRNGTHFLSAPLTLTGADSGLTLQSFPGEEAWLSRGVPLTVSWTQEPAPGPSGWQGPFTGINAVDGGSEGYPYHIFGTTPDAATCQAACSANFTGGGRCTVYTWHSPKVSGFANQCWFRMDHKWSPFPQVEHTSGYLAQAPNIWKATVSSSLIPTVAGLRAPDGSRMWRARYPNSNPEYSFGDNLRADSWIKTSVPIAPAMQYEPSTPNRTSSYSFIHYQGGAGGICSVPGFGFAESNGTQYWCGSKTEGGGAFTWRTPVGMVTNNKSLPNVASYKNVQDAVIQAWHPARWASRMYRMDSSGFSYDASTGSATFNFAEGGYQDARGSDGAGDWYIENVREELDEAGEWFWDKETQELYVFYNATAGTPPPSDGSIVAIADGAWSLITVAASQESPAKGLSFLGLGFRDTANVFFAPHSIPSGGDWALARHGALLLEGTEGASVDGCLFERLDGTALMVSGYNRDTRITGNAFKWIGDSAIVAWGKTVGDPTGEDGWDASDGNQPRYTFVENNIASEFGIWEKQSSLYMQAKTSDSFLHGNVGFNGPRAGINFNDGFGGNSTLLKNLVFNVCRESGDHGPFNSCDRQLFVTYKGTASTGFYTDYNHLTSNFLICNYESQEGIDNDDGSAYYNSSYNFMYLSGNGMKSDFGGHDNIHHHNVYAYVGKGYGICNQLKGHPDQFYNNHVIQDRDGDYGGGQECVTNANADATVVFDNSIYTPTGLVTECGKSLADWQAQGGDPGTTAATIPDDATLLALAKAALGM